MNDIQNIYYCFNVSPDRNLIEEVWVFAKTKDIAKIYWNSITQLVPNIYKYKVRLGIPLQMDGLNHNNAVILLCGDWYKNRRSNSDFIHYILSNCFESIPVSCLPDERMETEFIIGKDEGNGTDYSVRVWGKKEGKNIVVTDIEYKDKDDDTWKPANAARN